MATVTVILLSSAAGTVVGGALGYVLFTAVERYCS